MGADSEKISRDALAKLRRRMGNARSEIGRAMRRFEAVDALAGHRDEALRLAREVRDAANDAVRRLGG